MNHDIQISGSAAREGKQRQAKKLKMLDFLVQKLKMLDSFMHVNKIMENKLILENILIYMCVIVIIKVTIIHLY